MNRRYFLTVAACAAATCVLTVAVFLPRELGAIDQNKLDPTIATPKLVVNGVELTLKSAGNGDGAALAAGQKPALEIHAVNNTSDPASIQCAVAISYFQRGSEMSRMPMMPRNVWQSSRTIAVGPRQTVTVPLDVDKPLPAGGNIIVTLGSGKESIVALRTTSAPVELAQQLRAK